MNPPAGGSARPSLAAEQAHDLRHCGYSIMRRTVPQFYVHAQFALPIIPSIRDSSS